MSSRARRHSEQSNPMKSRSQCNPWQKSMQVMRSNIQDRSHRSSLKRSQVALMSHFAFGRLAAAVEPSLDTRA